MSIKLLLRSASAITIGLIIVLGLSGVHGQIKIQELVNQSNIIGGLSRAIFYTSSLTSDYLLDPSERSIQQWRASLKNLNNQLSSLDDRLGDSLSIAHQIKDSLMLFDRLETLRLDPQSSENDLLKSILVGQLLTRTEAMISRLQLFEQDIHNEMEYQQQFYQWLGFGLLIIFAISAIILFTFLTKRISIPLDELKKTAVDIGGGDFSARVQYQVHDEFGSLALEMNAMAANLQETTARKDQLDFEILHRRESEKKLEEQQRIQKQLIKKLEQVNNQLIQSEKMAAVGQLAAGVAHEINNPAGFVGSNLNAIQRYIKNLRILFDEYGQLNEVLPEEQRQAIQVLIKDIGAEEIWEDLDDTVSESIEGMNRVCKIVTDLKDFSHKGNGEMGLHNLNDALESTLNVVRNELKYKAEVILELQNLPMVECDLQQLNQVFMNLLTNAAHSIDVKGQVFIRTASHKKGVLIEIEDTGCGIDDKHMDRLFEPFFTTKAPGKGTGLGLSISYGIVNQHGGEITVTSEVGVGTTFNVVLPFFQSHRQDEIVSN